MKRVRSIIGIIFVILLTSTQLFADVDEAGKIKRIIVEGTSIVSVWLDGADVRTECSGGNRWTIRNSDPMFKEKVSTLLAAASSGLKVHLHHLTAWKCGPWNSNTIYYINVTY